MYACKLGGVELENELIKLAASQGIWATLSIFLIFYILKAQKDRAAQQAQTEKSYQDLIEELTKKFNIIGDVDRNVKSIKNNLEKLKNKKE